MDLDDILISSINNSDAGGSFSGKVYLLLGSSLQGNATIDLGNADYSFVAESTSGDHLGYSVASAGDVDGDGLDDILIGAPESDDSGLSSGKAYLILGQTLLSSNNSAFNLGNADHIFVGTANVGYAGNHVKGLGDVDGDGLDDTMIGAYRASFLKLERHTIFVPIFDGGSHL